MRTLAVPGIQDTQCGFKAFRREVGQAIFRAQKIDGFAFDVETLAIARRWGYGSRRSASRGPTGRGQRAPAA